MLSKVTLINYGPHRNTVLNHLDICNGVEGPNSSGKTWILDGIVSALTCQGITADDMYNDGAYAASKTSIELEWKDGRVLKLERSGNTQTVDLTSADGTHVRKTGIRQAADEVREFTGMLPMALDTKVADRYIQVKELFDNTPFLVTRSPESLLRFITALTPNPLLIKADKRIGKRLSELPALIAFSGAPIAEAKKELVKYDLNKAEKMEALADKMQSRAQRVELAEAKIEGLERCRELTRRALKSHEANSQVVELLATATSRAKAHRKRLRILWKLTNAEAAAQEALKEIEENRAKIAALEPKLGKARQQRFDLLKAMEAKKTPKGKVCPTCGAPL